MPIKAHWEAAKQAAEQSNSDVNSSELLKKMKKHIFDWKLRKQSLTVIMNEPQSIKILNALLKKGEVKTDELVREQDKESRKMMLTAMQTLVNDNILRYTNMNTLQWHGRPQEKCFTDMLTKKQ